MYRIKSDGFHNCKISQGFNINLDHYPSNG